MGIFSSDTGGSERPGPDEIWRTWLVTGGRSHPIDRRRLQGEHRGLKQLLAEGGEADVLSRPWRDFSRAMVRQSVNEAMGRLTVRERVVVTMAYFAGFSNEEIADELGMTVRGVQRSLRRALDGLSSALERGRRIALAVLAAVAGGRAVQWLRETLSTAEPQVLAAVVVAGIVVAAPPAAPVHHVTPFQVGVTPAIAWPSTPRPPAAPDPPAAATSGSVPTAPAVVAPSAPMPGTPSIAVPKLPAVKPPAIPLPHTLKRIL